MNEEGVHLYLL